MSDFIEKLKKTKTKVMVNVTIDETLLKEINDFKEKHSIPQLSPLINEMLWEWIKNEEKKNGNDHKFKEDKKRG
jgi:metal-responsive CopG/Arc/MetJ family transcriptional regulator